MLLPKRIPFLQKKENKYGASTPEIKEYSDCVVITNEPLILSQKIKKFVDWFNGYASKTGDALYNNADIRSLIEQTAFWYERRYLERDVKCFLPFIREYKHPSTRAGKAKNKGTNNYREDISDITPLDWEDLLLNEPFFRDLPLAEKSLFLETSYPEIVYVERTHFEARLHLDSDGIVTSSKDFNLLPTNSGKAHNMDLDHYFVGKHLRDVISILKANDLFLPEGNELEDAIYKAKHEYIREELLNCIMYRLIEIGGKRLGPRRAFLFAKEFDRNIAVPVMYGIDESDIFLRDFINEYLKAGGSESLECYINYFTRSSDDADLPKRSISSILADSLANNILFTEEEIELHQRMINSLKSFITRNADKKDEVIRLVLEREETKK